MAGVLFLFLPTAAPAFNIDTHVWVGQQVLNDVIPDGKVTIEPYGEFTVDPEIVYALRNYQYEYRMGNVGPDGLPDILAGQMAVHPGVVGAWQTDDWLKWVFTGASNAEQKAFAYGYLSHAAADIFAHSYVNTYAGDIFLLTDGEQEVELRHFALEKYIVTHTPPIKDYMGNPLGKAYQLVSTPQAFLSDRLILNSTVANQYDQTPTGITRHLTGMYKVKDSLDNAVGKADNIISLMSSGITNFNKQITDFENHVTELDKEIDDSTNKILFNQDLIDQQNKIIDTSVTLVVYWTNEASRLQSLIDEANDQITDLQNQLANTVKETCSEVCQYFCPKQLPGCDQTCGTVCNLTSEWIDLSNRLDQKIRNKATYVADQTTALQNKVLNEAAIDVANQTKATAQAIIDAAQAAILAAQDLKYTINAQLIQARRDLADLIQRSIEMDPIRAALAKWRDDVTSAVQAYAKANGDVMVSILKGDGNSLQPLSDWMSCWSPVFGGVPSEIPQAGCMVKHTIDQIMADIDEIKSKLGNMMWLIDPVGQLKDAVQAKLEPILEDEAVKLIDKVGGPDMANFANLQVNGISSDLLNSIYATDNSGKNLLIIKDVASRVDAEMHLTADGYFDPLQYRVVRDAVMLSKLSLLGADQLDLIAAAAGVGTTIYGPQLYSDKANFNILFDLVKSIDGNQQWQQTALPYPRRNNVYALWPDIPYGYPFPPRYGFAFDPSVSDFGFRPWYDPSSRKQIFNLVFQGPLAPGIEYPTEFNMTDILGDYPFRACKQNPFPRTKDDNGQYMQDATGAYRDPGCDEDLLITSLNWKAPGRGDRVLLFEAVVNNQGARSAPISEIALYLSTNDKITTSSGILLGKHVLKSLAPGESVDARAAFNLPHTLPSGRYYVGAIIDPDGKVNESNETNNTLFATPAILVIP